jgi:tetratricopeptide (TPR) repeat protein
LDKPLHGKRVAFTGRLASMTRDEAAELVAAHGGEIAPSVTRRTTHLVVGREGWPLERDGRLTRKLETARSLEREGHAIAIVPEEEFLEQLGLGDRQDGIQRLYTTAQLSRMLSVSGASLRAWVRSGLIRPERVVHRLCYFAFRQVASARMLRELMRGGATTADIRRSLEQLAPFLRDTDEPLKQLALLEGTRGIVAELDGGQLVAPGGQLYFDFSRGKTQAPVVIAREPSTVADWFDRALAHEDAGRFDAAADCYRQALLLDGPEPELCFNLGNVLYALGRKAPAAERFRQAIELERDYIEAWNNLANTLGDLGEREEAIAAYRRALTIEPGYADAHYNLADTLAQMGRMAEARRHWQTYLELDPHSASARALRQRLHESTAL